MAYTPRKTLTCERLLICEGTTDQAFFAALIEQRKLPEFCIRIPEDASPVRGITGYPTLLAAIPSWEGAGLLKHIVIVADNDSNAKSSFKVVCDYIKGAQPDMIPPFVYGVPHKADVGAVGTPAVTTVIMVPRRGQQGCLETLLLEAAQTTAKAQLVGPCLDQFAACTGVDGWTPNRRAKMRLQSTIAATNKGDPTIPLSKVWLDKPSLIPLSHQVFDPISGLLAKI